jgi:hypothetical protein
LPFSLDQPAFLGTHDRALLPFPKSLRIVNAAFVPAIAGNIPEQAVRSAEREIPLAAPRKQYGGKVRGRSIALLLRVEDSLCSGVGLDHLAIKMPGGVAEYRHDYCQAKEERYRANDQERRND